MSAEDIMSARSCAVQQILGTDMKKHFDILSRFQVDTAVLTLLLDDACCVHHIT